jgi:hypothetical protein
LAYPAFVRPCFFCRCFFFCLGLAGRHAAVQRIVIGAIVTLRDPASGFGGLWFPAE